MRDDPFCLQMRSIKPDIRELWTKLAGTRRVGKAKGQARILPWRAFGGPGKLDCLFD